MKQFQWHDLDPADRSNVLARPRLRTDAKLQSAVRDIVEEVRATGWDGLCAIASRIDGEEPNEVAVAPLAERARRRLGDEEIAALEFAAGSIRSFHEASRPSDFSMETSPGLTVTQSWRPIDPVGLYVPGGKTPLFSSLMMLAIPARAAGVREIVAVTPPRPGGGLDELIALAAELSGIERIWTVGGAQAIAALAFGAGAIPRVDKICGPGNAWVAEAKRLVGTMAGGPALDMPAGPSELMVIADAFADPGLVAADLLSQAEHDRTAQVLLVTTSPDLAEAVARDIEQRLATLPRAAIARASLDQSRAIIVDDMSAALDIANCYAPEHLSFAARDSQSLVGKVRNAGAIFAGAFAAETFGDYLAGSSHVLPTDGAARAWSGVSVFTFMKAISIQNVTREGASRLASPAALLARLESLEAHARAADVRSEVFA